MTEISSQYSHMDTRWSWLILVFTWIASYLLSFIASQAGLLQVDMMENLSLGSGPVSIMTSIAVGCCSLLGPVSGILASLLSIRVTIFMGVTILTIGFVCASFSSSLPALIFFYGILVGVGFGLCFSSHLIIVNFYFEKHLLLANGILLAAPGIADMSIPFLVRYTLDLHGWRYTMVINAAIIFHVLIFAAFFSPTSIERRSMINWSKVCSSGNCDRDYEEANTDASSDLSSTFDEKKNMMQKDAVNSVEKHDVIFAKDIISVEKSILSVDKLKNKHISEIYCNDLQQNKVNTILPDVAGISTGCIINGRNSVLGTVKPDIIINSYLNQGKNPASSLSDLKYVHFENGYKNTNHSMDCITLHCMKEISEDTADYLNSRKNNNSSRQELSVPPVVPRRRLSSSLLWASAEFGSSIIAPFHVEPIDSEEKECASVLRQIKRIFRTKSIWFLCLNLMLVFCGYGIHSIHFPSFVEEKGFSQDVAKFYSVYGLGLVVGRVGGGLLYNKIQPPLVLLLFILELMLGLILGLAPFYANTATGLFIFEAGFGLLYGQCYLMISPILSKILGLEYLQIAYGCLQLFLGIGLIVSPILAGFVYDATNTFDIPFYMAGAVIVVSSFLLPVLLLVDGLKEEKDKTTDDVLARSEPLLNGISTEKSQTNS